MEIGTKITKVTIKSLWKRFDITWNLQPDVNILSGINGSGKSTILNCIAMLMTKKKWDKFYEGVIEKIEISYNDRREAYVELIPDEEPMLRFHHSYKSLNAVIDVISTFDKAITEVGNRPDENVRTELDRDIFRLQKLYLDFQLNINKKIVDALKNNRVQTEILKIREQQDKFLEIMDTLFEHTDKKINRDKNEITFLSGEEEITAYQLSSGEKQILVILLTTLIQDNKPAIIFMDEPEISLHFDWQKKLIQYIRALNPNVQIILATHSPAIIMEGWRDKVFDVRDLITNDRLKPHDNYAADKIIR